MTNCPAMGAVINEREAMDILDEARMDVHKYYEPGHMYYDSKPQTYLKC